MLWFYRLGAAALFWYAGLMLSRAVLESSNIMAVAGVCALAGALLLDIVPMPGGKTLDAAKAEREGSRKSPLATKVDLPPTRQRPGLRPASWSLWLLSGLFLAVSDLWIHNPGEQWASVALVVAGVVALALLGTATSSAARGEPSLRARLSLALPAGRHRQASRS